MRKGVINRCERAVLNVGGGQTVDVWLAPTPIGFASEVAERLPLPEPPRVKGEYVRGEDGSFVRRNGAAIPVVNPQDPGYTADCARVVRMQGLIGVARSMELAGTRNAHLFDPGEAHLFGAPFALTAAFAGRVEAAFQAFGITDFEFTLLADGYFKAVGGVGQEVRDAAAGFQGPEGSPSDGSSSGHASASVSSPGPAEQQAIAGDAAGPTSSDSSR